MSCTDHRYIISRGCLFYRDLLRRIFSKPTWLGKCWVDWALGSGALHIHDFGSGDVGPLGHAVRDISARGLLARTSRTPPLRWHYRKYEYHASPMYCLMAVLDVDLHPPEEGLRLTYLVFWSQKRFATVVDCWRWSVYPRTRRARFVFGDLHCLDGHAYVYMHLQQGSTFCQTEMCSSVSTHYCLFASSRINEYGHSL